MKSRILAASLLSFAAISPLALADSHFAYSGIGLATSDLKKEFPTSLVKNEEAWLSEADSRGHVYYVRRTYAKEKSEIKMVLEKPEKYLSKQPQTWEEGHDAKFPSCENVSVNLVSQYGKPALGNNFYEERLEHTVRTWSSGDETLKLDCYRIDGKGKELAAEIDIVLSSDR